MNDSIFARVGRELKAKRERERARRAAQPVPAARVAVEQALLGRLMLDPSAWRRVGGRVRAADFEKPQLRVIFAAIERIARRGQPCDQASVFAALDAAGDLGQAGGATRLARVLAEADETTDAATLADRVFVGEGLE